MTWNPMRVATMTAEVTAHLTFVQIDEKEKMQ
jgi:hypothetical protein